MDSRKQYGFIDGIKGISILSIILVHWGAYSGNSVVCTYSAYGARAVEMFLIVSTFLSCKSYTRYCNNCDMGETVRKLLRSSEG